MSIQSLNRLQGSQDLAVVGTPFPGVTVPRGLRIVVPGRRAEEVHIRLFQQAGDATLKEFLERQAEVIAVRTQHAGAGQNAAPLRVDP